jgi:hypothetical protein
MSTPRSKAGRLHLKDGSIEPARFYYSGCEEEPLSLTQIDSRYTTWIEDDGTVGIRRGTSISVGASAAYSANYDTLDWGN